MSRRTEFYVNGEKSAIYAIKIISIVMVILAIGLQIVFYIDSFVYGCVFMPFTILGIGSFGFLFFEMSKKIYFDDINIYVKGVKGVIISCNILKVEKIVLQSYGPISRLTKSKMGEKCFIEIHGDIKFIKKTRFSHNDYIGLSYTNKIFRYLLDQLPGVEIIDTREI